jgi:outer membrane immunogenic protein
MKRAIRRLISGIAIAGFTQTALAADYSPEFFDPGPATYFNWGGFYFGVSGGGGVADAEFGTRSRAILNTFLAGSLPVASPAALGPLVQDLGPDNTGFASFGAFVGYNTQWESAILGIEANYHHTWLDASATSFVTGTTVSPGPNPGPDPIGPNPITWTNTVSMTSVIELKDYTTIRGRMGWAFGTFMPYATLGMAIGRADITNTGRLQYVGTFAGGIPAGAGDLRLSEIKKDEFAFGYEFALGVDWMIMSGLFLRAEYEFVQFAKFGERNLTLNTARAGLGYKF